ncbi:DUF4097 family beta strand repeat-containing protein [Shewanella cyperi]|uniref:hypothetical protein n=1 Tax=Shewanella cyperi TaxID=2814292 RepID=UPI001A93EBF6|nr:hypothetical protein [Shewanella cyperi]QSX41503.1 hypothetical protein JYB84_03445 [Shewanella cyperi]
MSNKSVLSVITAALVLGGCVFQVNSAPLEHSRQQLNLDTASLSSLKADTGAGELVIMGVPGLERIEVEADIYTRTDIPAILTLKREGKHAKLEARFEEHAYKGNSPYIDLLVKVPAELALDINDGSGAIRIGSVDADISVNDGSGDLEIRGGRNIDISDGSGDLLVEGSTGKINITDGSGDIKVAKTGADVTVTDGSGSMVLTDIGGLVTLSDGSGNIEVHNTQGLTVLNAGSGGIKYDSINGPVNLR